MLIQSTNSPNRPVHGDLHGSQLPPGKDGRTIQDFSRVDLKYISWYEDNYIESSFDPVIEPTAAAIKTLGPIGITGVGAVAGYYGGHLLGDALANPWAGAACGAIGSFVLLGQQSEYNSRGNARLAVSAAAGIGVTAAANTVIPLIPATVVGAVTTLGLMAHLTSGIRGHAEDAFAEAKGWR